MQTHLYPRLVGDVGGTNARFAFCEAAGADPVDLKILPCADYPRLQDAMLAYLEGTGRPVPRWCAIGIANPVDGDAVKMTNHVWSFSIEAVRQEIGFERFVVVNDFVALALALPALTPAELVQVGGGQAVAGGTIGLLGAGTGLGVATLTFTHAGEPLALGGEGGHVTLAGADAEEIAVIERLRQRFTHASAERALSGPGLVNLYTALAQVRGSSAVMGDPAQVLASGLAGEDDVAADVLQIFCGLLGSVAGNLALTVGSRGGIYIGGGIVPRMGEAFAKSPFRTRFEAKGRFGDYLRKVPTLVIHTAQSPALIGASRALDAA
jgi:glucokinase